VLQRVAQGVLFESNNPKRAHYACIRVHVCKSICVTLIHSVSFLSCI